MDGTDAERRTIGNWPWWLLGVAVVVVAFASLSSGDDAEASYPADEARYACEAWVRDELKAPSTAQFTDGTATGEDGDWKITGSVDAENSFGAMLRTAWTCDARVDGDDWVGNVSLD